MCNFHSPELSGKNARAKGFMDVDLAKALIDQIARNGGEPWVAFHGAGESMLHRGLIDILSYAGRFRNVRSGFLTNAMLLDNDASVAILDSGVSWIGFSLDGIDKEKFERYRVGSDFDRIMENVLRFLALKNEKSKALQTTVNMTLQKEMQLDVERFIDFWIDRVDEVRISPYRPIGSRVNVLADNSTARIPCYMLYEMMIIYWNGETGLCCEDWFNEGKMGDTSRQDILDIWNGPSFRKARGIHEEGKFHEISLCRDCNSWFNVVQQEYLDEKWGCRVQKNAWQYIYRK